jgi:hypothetical protein
MKTVTEIIDHREGFGCECSAYYEGECCCEKADWTSSEELEMNWKMEFLRHKLKVHGLLTEEIEEILDNPFTVFSKEFSNKTYILNPPLEQYKDVKF